MPKYRGFEKELPKLAGYYRSPVSEDEIVNHFDLSGLGAAFSGPRTAPAPIVQISAPLPIVRVAAPAPAYQPTISPGLIDPGKIQPGIPGDIRDIVARDLPGEAVTDDADDMSAENGIPGVDDSGAFPYGDPKGNAKTGTGKEGGNQGLIIAAILAALLLGG